MSYSLRFHELALKEWKRLDATLQAQFKKKAAGKIGKSPYSICCVIWHERLL